jgi:hypothetical protein
MTRFIHDKFAKDYLEELLKDYGEVKSSEKISAEIKEIDVLFTPDKQQSSNLQILGLLGRFAENPALIEPLRVRQSLMGETPKTALAHHSAIQLLAMKYATVFSNY